MYLKTSYVIVQQVFAKHIILHHLAFKNILCYCSTTTGFDSAGVPWNLKTSYVIVQRKRISEENGFVQNLKTSYVIVQQ